MLHKSGQIKVAQKYEHTHTQIKLIFSKSLWEYSGV